METLNETEFLNIIIQSYEENNNERLEELKYCILGNLNNNYVKKIYDLTSKNNLSELITSNPKYKKINYSKWLTFKDAFEFSNLYKNEYFVIINTDIMLDSNSPWESIKVFLDNHFFLAISRHEYDKEKKTFMLDPSFSNILHCHTQDGWFFKTPVNINQCDFEIGLLGCDNAIAHRIINSGYLILNKPLQFKLFHVDSVRGKNSKNFLEHHHENDKNKIANKHPENEGYYLLPNCDYISDYSIDSLITQFNFSPVEKYKLICDIFTSKIKINNNPK